jgi:hypothetical protein
MTEKRQFCPKGHDTFLVGRDSGYRCLKCKRESASIARWARLEEQRAAQAAELEAKRAEEAKRQAAERKRILKAGGPDAQWLIWNEAYTESLAKDEGGLCQWQDEVDGNYLPRQCFQQADEWDVYCAHHNQVLEEQAAARKKADSAPER